MKDLMESVRTALAGKWEGDSLKATCPVHDSEHLYVQPPDRDGFPTFVCRREATWSDLRPALAAAGVPAQALRGSERTAQGDVQDAEPFPGMGALLDAYPARLHSPEGERYWTYLSGIGITKRQAEREHLGLVRHRNGNRITWPVFDKNGVLVQVRLWDPFADPQRRRLWLRGRGAKHLFGVQHLEDAGQDELVLLVEGDTDYLAAVANGARAVGVTGGAGTVPADMSAFAGRRVVVCFDADEPGRKGARKTAAALVEAGATVWVADVAEHVSEGGDLRDWLVGGSGSRRRMREWMEKVSAEHPLSPGDLAAVDESFDDRVQARYDNLQADRAARRLIAREEATGLWSGFTDTSLRSLLAEPRDLTPWVIEGLLRRGHKAVLTAAFKVGKTTLLSNVVRSLVDGVPLFGQFPVVSMTRRVAIFDYELTSEDAADMYERVDVINDEQVLLSSLRSTGFSLANDVHAEQVVDHFRRNEVGVWLIDPYARAMRGFGSENSNDDVGAFLARVDQIAAEAELDAVVISAHTGRGEQLVGSEHARGATKIDDDPDARWIYTKDESGSRFFRAEGRNRVGCDEIALAHDPDTELLTASTFSRSDSKYFSKAQAATRIVLGADGGVMKATELQGHMAGSDEKPKRAVVAFAVRQGWLTEDARGGRAGTWYSAGPVRFEDKLRLP